MPSINHKFKSYSITFVSMIDFQIYTWAGYVLSIIGETNIGHCY